MSNQLGCSRAMEQHKKKLRKYCQCVFLKVEMAYSLLGVFSFYIEKLVFFFRFTINKNDTEERGKGEREGERDRPDFGDRWHFDPYLVL